MFIVVTNTTRKNKIITKVTSLEADDSQARMFRWPHVRLQQESGHGSPTPGMPWMPELAAGQCAKNKRPIMLRVMMITGR